MLVPATTMNHTPNTMFLSGRCTLLRTLMLTTALAAAPLTWAQEAKVRVKVKADLEAKPDEGIGVARMVKGDAGSVVALKTKGGRTVLGGVMQPELDWSLVAYDREKLTLIKSDKPKIVWGIGPVALETIVNFGGQFRLIASKPDKEKAKLLVLQQVLSPRSLTGKAAQLLYELPFDRLGKGPEYFVDNMAIGFTTTTSVDSTKLLLGLTPASTTRSAGAPIWAMVLDKQMKPLWNNTLTTDPAARNAQVIDVRVDKSGAAWYLVKNISDPAPKTKEVLGYSYELYRLDSAGQTSVKLDLPGKNFAQDARFELRADGSIVCGGIYSDPEPNRNESLGMFRMELDIANMKWVGFNAFPFALQMVKKVEKLQNDMRLVRMIERKDGGLFLIAEKAGTETTMVSDLSGKKVAKTQWVNGALHVMQVGRTGAEPVWYKQIERQLAYDDADPGNVVAGTAGDLLFVFYNDSEKNIENRKAKLPVEQVTTAKDLIMLEFKADGTDKGRVVLKEGFKQGFLSADRVWHVGPGIIGTLGAPAFGKGKTYPVLVELLQETKK
ncbi:MAG TPA: hypothetical protein VGE21_08350 [Flavobacteriales bacterium]